MITIIGLGPGDPGQLSVAAVDALRKASRLFIRTAQHPTVEDLRSKGVSFETMDSIYEQASTFEEVYTQIADCILNAAHLGDVAYAVPGHPLMGEKAVLLILERAQQEEIPVNLVPSPGYVDALAVALREDLGENLRLLDAMEMPKALPDPRIKNLVYQVFDQQVASDVKLALMEIYPDEHPVAVVCSAGIPGKESVRRVPLFELDRGEFDHLTTVYVPPVPNEKRRPDFNDFVEVMARLRGENGCPWDRKQTHQSLKKYIIEEGYEVLEAIDLQDDDKLSEELGDLMLQVLFHAQLGAEEGRFDIRDVIEGIVTKLIRRHPHVFGEVEVANAEEVLVNWDKIKVQEKEQAGKEERISVLGGVPRQLPALMRAHEISKRAARSGFDWDNIDGVMDKLSEEIQELEEAAGTGDKEHLQEELGDILFVLVSVARHHKLDPEEALRHATDKFMRRFHYVEDRINEMGKSFEDFNPQELDAFWNEAKKEGR